MHTLCLPALRAKMGDWIYYITFMKFRFIAERVKAAEEIHKSDTLKELIQRELDESKHAEQIRRYLMVDSQRFFNSLVIGVYRGAPEWFELRVSKSDSFPLNELPSYLDGAIGILTLRGDEKLFAIDGQHRVVGIREAVAKKKSLAREEVSAIFVGHKDDASGRERTRRLFTRLNRFAKPVRKEEIIALDEDDVVAILTRWFVEDSPLFQQKVSIHKTKSLPKSDKQSFTTISTLYDCIDTFLRTHQPEWNDFKRIRPGESEIKRFLKRAKLLWTALARNFPPVKEVFYSKVEECVAGSYRDANGGNLLLRPIGLQLVVDVISRLKANGKSLSVAARQVASVPMQLQKPPWVGLLWDNTNRRMITQPENQKAAFKLLYQACGGNLADLKVKKQALRKELAGLLNRTPSQVKLPIYYRGTAQ